MSEQLTPEVVDALVCEVGRRPSGAPTIEEILGAVTAIDRTEDTLTVTFEPTAAETVRAVVAAERQCCSTIEWRLETERGVRLHISGRPLQLETLEAMFGARAGS